MNRIITITGLATAALLSQAIAAHGADLPRFPVKGYRPPMPIAYNWTGYYVGFNLGYHSGKDDSAAIADPANWIPAAKAAIDAQTPGSVKPKGFTGGIQGGYNWQISNFVLGLELDANMLTGTGSRDVPLVSPAIAAGDFFSTSTKATFLGTVRPRLGYAFDNWLVYGTGGLAVGQLKTTDSVGVAGGGTVSTTNATTTRVGWAAGGGVEYGLGAWTAKLEYLHVDLGNFDTAVACLVGCGAPNDVVVNHKYTDEVIRIGLNYRFGRF